MFVIVSNYDNEHVFFKNCSFLVCEYL